MTNTMDAASLLQRVHALNLTLGELQKWLQTPHTVPLDSEQIQSVLIPLKDLESRLRQWEAEPALLTVVFMGGTGVGKSTLLNALAGNKVAASGITRPTTQYPTVYHHKDVRLDRLDPAFGQCRSVAHERAALRQKIIIDTPDMDGNVIEHHQRLQEILPVADAVLYVGSQEKYHDREGWKLLLAHRKSRGFAFVLNKWDRCLAGADAPTGTPPDEDFRRSLQAAGFTAPLIFRTCASHWAARRLTQPANKVANQAADELIDDDFGKLEIWLEDGLSVRAIQEIKLQGILGKIEQLASALEKVIPADWTDRGPSLKRAWEQALLEGAREHAELLLLAADRHAPSLNRHFAQLGRQSLRGPFAYYLNALDWVSLLNFSVLPLRRAGANTEAPIIEVATLCVGSIPPQRRDSQQEALYHHLLALADRQGWPISSLETFLPDRNAEALGRGASASTLSDGLVSLEREFADPTGARLAARVLVRGLCNCLPWTVIALVVGWSLSCLFQGEPWGISGYLGGFMLFAATLGGLHFLVTRFTPSRWEGLRPRLLELLAETLLERAAPVYMDAIDRFITQSRAERDSAAHALHLLCDLRQQLHASQNTGEPSSLFARVS